MTLNGLHLKNKFVVKLVLEKDSLGEACNSVHLSQEKKRMAYLALVRLSLKYGAAIWDTNFKTDKDRI